MSDDYKYPGLDQPTPSTSMNVNLPISLLSLALAVFIGAQVRSTGQLGDTMNWQLENLEKQKKTLADAKKSYGDLLLKRDETVNQATALEKEWVDIFNDVIDLSKDDKDAATVVAKYGIKRNDDGKKPEAKPEEKKPEEKKP